MKNIHQCKVCFETFSLLRYLRKHITVPAVGDDQLNKCQSYYSKTCNLQENLQVNHKIVTENTPTDELNLHTKAKRLQLISTYNQENTGYTQGDDCTNLEDEPACLKFEPDEEDELYYFDRDQQSLPFSHITNTSSQRSVYYEDRTTMDNMETISMPDEEKDETPTRKHAIIPRPNIQIRENRCDGVVVNTIEANLSPDTTTCKKSKLPCASLEIHYETLHKLPMVSFARVKKNQINLKSKRKETDNKEEATRKTKTHKCKICSKTFATLSNLKRHTSGFHDGNTFNCNICQKTFHRLESLKQHKLSIHNNGKYKCDSCQVGFKCLKNLKRHKSYVHEQIGFKCDNCPKQFSTSHILDLHNASTHEGVRYKCDMCEKQFRCPQNLKEHKASSHDNVLYKCDMCEKQFRYRQNLRKHKISSHDKVRYNCDKCEKQYCRKENLTQHKASSHDELRY